MFNARSEQAIDELSKKYGTLFTKVANNILNNQSDSEECINDAYLAVWNTIPPQKPNPLLSYVCRIVRNLAIKKYHSNTAIKRNSYYDIALDELSNCFSTCENIEDEYNIKELTDSINAFLEKLDKDNRIIFVRRYWYSDSVGDIATLLKMREHNVSVRLFRIREKLKKYLITEGFLL